ncbi:hypothetical protein BCR43DRAFT_493480 [Syncephalastrum racemosum]|uniref:Uncharacterized protein n=1 Tax=Syncephalastrum racemosum TaxID=13706 RepID=A0A1X2HAQ2_SYNRA|nr:hypothetical protein BCR43DRAFT_493480 [Syncephalastrum racemosum]
MRVVRKEVYPATTASFPMPISVLIHFSISSVPASSVLPRQPKVLLCRSQNQEPKNMTGCTQP